MIQLVFNSLLADRQESRDLVVGFSFYAAEHKDRSASIGQVSICHILYLFLEERGLKSFFGIVAFDPGRRWDRIAESGPYGLMLEMIFQEIPTDPDEERQKGFARFQGGAVDPDANEGLL